MQKKITAVLFVLTLALSVLNIPATAASQPEINNLENQKEEIAKQKEAISNEIAGLQDKQASIMEQKNALDMQNELTQQEIVLVNEQIDIYTAVIETKARELEEAVAVENEHKEALRVRLRAMEERGTLSYIAVLFKASSFTDLLARIEMVSQITKSDKELEEQYIAAREHVEEVKAEYEVLKAGAESAKAELEVKRAQLEENIAEAAALIAELEKDIAAYEEAENNFDKETDRIQAEIDAMVEELARREAANPGSGQSVTGTGSLIFPLKYWTSISYSYGPRYHPILHYTRPHNGEDISAPSGTPIYAADSGTVVTAAYSAGGFGNYVCISHGNGMTTLYAHMTSYTVSSGQAVAQGDLIGYVGSTGLSTGPHLHFEVRVNGVYQNPMSYFNIS